MTLKVLVTILIYQVNDHNYNAACTVHNLHTPEKYFVHINFSLTAVHLKVNIGFHCFLRKFLEI